MRFIATILRRIAAIWMSRRWEREANAERLRRITRRDEK